LWVINVESRERHYQGLAFVVKLIAGLPFPKRDFQMVNVLATP
jgi:hypothetical protein